MKIRVLSDLHIEFGDWHPPPADADVIVLAGDIDLSSEGLRWARYRFPDHPIVYVAGNHEFYGGHMERELEKLRQDAIRLDVLFLDNDAVTIADVRFLGATLWTDFKLDGSSNQAQSQAKAAAHMGMNDFQSIGYSGRRFHPDDAQMLHRHSIDWLKTQLAKPFSGRTVVVTHHLPLRECVHAKYAGSTLNAAFASHLPHLVRQPVDLWIHGHIHESVALAIDSTRVVCNPRGYAGYELNPSFDPELVIELPATSREVGLAS